eukprot:m.210620 g.210620  ORF g.210620 m.210620 type:complete len:239 (-) comp19011_c2_seq9:471-1187(-)
MASASTQKQLKTGDAFPVSVSECIENSGKPIKILEQVPCVLFFYPEANTPGCTRQACGFRDNFGVFKSKGYSVFGVSMCVPEKQTTFQSDFNLPYSLLTFSSEQIEQIGLTRENGKVVRGHIVLGRDGKVAHAEYTVSPEESIERATTFVKTVATTEASSEHSAKPAVPGDGDDDDEDDGGGLASLLNGDLEDDDSDSDDFVPGEEEDDDALIEDDADEDNEADSPSEGRISKKPRLG